MTISPCGKSEKKKFSKNEGGEKGKTGTGGRLIIKFQAEKESKLLT